MSSITKKRKSDSNCKLYELTLPNSWDSALPFIKKNPIILLILNVLLIFYSAWAGNLVLFGFIVRIKYLLLIYIIFQIIYRMDSRVSIGLGLFSLILSTNFLISNQSKKAELLAMYAYFFLAVGVFWQLYEYLVEERQGEKNRS